MNRERKQRRARLEALLDRRIAILDGAMGTALQELDPDESDFGGAEFEGCIEHLVLTRPDMVAAVHRSYLEAGADIIETNTFGGTPLVLSEFGLADRADEINREAARLARRVADEFGGEHPRFVAGSMGPTTKAISVTGGITFAELQQTFGRQARALAEGGVDYLLLETCQDTRNVKAALLGIDDALAEAGVSVPVAVSITIEPMGTMLAGQNVEALVASLEHRDLLYLGLNCATGPDFMTDHLRSLSELARTRTACVPNAGLPDEDGRYLETPRMITAVLARFMQEGWLNLAGGCCGTTPAHIRAIREAAREHEPRPVPRHDRCFVSGIESLELEESIRPALVGERTNVLGSRRFKRLIREEKLDEATDIARRQVKRGAHILDVCLQDPDRDEIEDARRFFSVLIQKVKVPLMIDTTDASVMEEALTFCQGKAILNSVNLEDGEERFREVAPLARRYGAALVVGTIDEDPQHGMAVTRGRKLEIARRSHRLLVEEYGIPPTDLIFDPLVFPCATGDENYLGSARETIEGVRLIKQELPQARTILGISNVSFGLPPAGREVLNSVFLYHCTKAGLDLAIVNTEKLERFASIPDQEKRLAEAVLFEPSDETIAAFANHFRDASSRVVHDVSQLSLDERLSNYVIEGSRDGLIPDLDLKMREAAPLEIINGPLMAGMDEVGRLFNNNELIVAEVLQSAEAMKAAVAHLEPHMDRSETGCKGKLVLATVKGDVHDIGKNLVEIILSNNGYQVVNLGIKVPPHELIDALREHRPDAVGLSGLLVKSAQQMVITAHELTQVGLCPPLLVGGAALTRSFTRLRIAPEYGGTVLYAQDAMDGLDLINRLMNPELRPELEEQLGRETARLAERRKARSAPRPRREARPLRPLTELPAAPDFRRHLLRDVRLDEVWPYLNPSMLYGKHLGLKGRVTQRLQQGEEKAARLQELIGRLQQECRNGLMRGSAVWRFMEAEGEGDSVRLFEAGAPGPEAEFRFPRSRDGLCLADYVARAPVNGQPRDTLCLFAVTAGEGIREAYQRYKEAGEYLHSHAIQALAIETAEALAEWLHAKLRGQWGFPDPPALTMQERFKARYRGKRYSFGYPACPALEDQAALWELLRPEEIGIRLTDEYMMEPEASVSALVFHHPEARYFSALDEEPVGTSG